ncbi:MAG: cyclic nucleotide-binding domain-containing protein [Desulfobacterales bacterium]|nr:cyclic nucleotide-binding domain-containing protein [Desulfobacterales bacterium]MBF0396903.1 cyclic nucleotide-binding domain-containing protein [Desulfobacterales bacterium]
MIESKYLKTNIQNIQELLTIPALRNFETNNLGKLLNFSKIRKYNHGEPIIKEGDNDYWLYFLLSGKVLVSKNGIKIGEIDKKGEIFGEMRLIDKECRSASVYANGETVCLAVNVSPSDRMSTTFDGSMDEQIDFLLLLYRIFAEFMSNRLRLTNEELANKKNELKKMRGLLKAKNVHG